MSTISPYLKAVLAFIVPGVTALVTAITEQSAGGETITGTEWLGALFACILTAGVVYAVPNQTGGQHRADVNLED